MLLLAFFVFSAGSFLADKDPSADLSPWVEIDGEKFRRSEDGRYNVNGVPTLVMDRSNSDHRGIKNTLQESISELELPKVKLKKERKSKEESQLSLGENAGELANKLGNNPLEAYNPENAAQFSKTIKQTKEKMKQRKKELEDSIQ